MAQVLYPSTSSSSSANRFNRARQPRMTAPLPQISLTGKIVRKTVHILLESKGFHQEHVLTLIDISRCQDNEEETKEFIRKIAECVQSIVTELNKANKVPSCSEQLGWVIHAGNMHSEFRKVIDDMFREKVTWGRIVALLQFASDYTLFSISQGIHGSIVESVCGWTTVFLERELNTWFQEHPWEEFLSYAEKVLSAKRRHEMDTPTWQRMATIGGAIGLGAVLAFTIGNAFS